MHRLWVVALLLGCAESQPVESAVAAEGPDPVVACRAFSDQWEQAGPFEVLGCRKVDGQLEEEDGVRRYTMELEGELRVLETTQIFAAGGLEHRSGPQGDGARRPAGEVVRLREELLLVETDSGWQAPSVTAE